LEEARLSFRGSVPAWTEDCVLSVPMQQAAEFVSAGGFRERVVREVAGVGL
jgi:hypothetical protein